MNNLSKISIVLQLLFTLFVSSNTYAQFINKHWGKSIMISPNKSKIEVSFAVGLKETTKGLSGMKPDQMKANEGLFFYYEKMGPMAFWMPNTFFNLDIIFIDKDLRVVAVEENMKHFEKKGPPEEVPMTKQHHAQYVLELKAGQAKKFGIKPGKFIKWSDKSEKVKLFRK